MRLSEIHLYPVKSLGGIRVEQWPVDKRGLRYDRQWMVVDGSRRFLTQRQLPEMTLIQPAISGNSLTLSAANRQNIQIPLHQQDGEALTVTIWRDEVSARIVSREADAWISDVLARDCRLVYLPEQSRRSVDRNYADGIDEVGFADGFPFLLISEGSLQELNRLLEIPLGMERFRPNLVVSGCEGYAEDAWRRIRIGEIGFRLPKPCSRCAIPAIDPQTACRDREPLDTLNRTRRWNNQIYFGQNALHDNTGTLRTGDEVSVLLMGPAQPPLKVGRAKDIRQKSSEE